jgi:hypothetical protein
MEVYLCLLCILGLFVASIALAPFILSSRISRKEEM